MLKRFEVLVLALIVMFFTFGIPDNKCAGTNAEYIDMLDESFGDEHPGLVYDISVVLADQGWDALAQSLINGAGKYNSLAIQVSVEHGYMTEYIPQFIAAGKLDSSYASKTTDINSSTTVETPKAKTEFTVIDVEPYTAWATQDCNIRSGADTSYDKAGSLKQYEEVTVTGKASTGWFRITTSNGTEAYISDTLLTTENPSNREYTTVNDSGEILTYEFTDTPPEVIDEIIEDIENGGEEHEHSYTSEVTKEATCTEVGETTYTCECGDTYTEEIPMIEHSVGEWEVSKKPTLISKGEKVKRCTVCGEILETEEIPAKTGYLVAIIVGCLAVLGGGLGFFIYKKKH